MSVVKFPGQRVAHAVGSAASDTRRWKAEIFYRNSFSAVFFEEIEELDAIIEGGPDWNTLVECKITLNRNDDA